MIGFVIAVDAALVIAFVTDAAVAVACVALVIAAAVAERIGFVKRWGQTYHRVERLFGLIDQDKARVAKKTELLKKSRQARTLTRIATALVAGWKPAPTHS